MTGPVHPEWQSTGADWPNRESSRFEQVTGIRWHYQRMGRGPVMLLLHGAGAATHSWRDLMPLLADRFDVIAPDLPGHGFTRISSRRQCALPAMATAVAGLLDHLAAAPKVIVGHSAGTAIALQIVLSKQLDPERVIGLNAALAPFRGIAGVLFPPLAKLLALNPVVPWVFSNMAGGAGQVRRLIAGTGSKIDSRGEALYARMISRSTHVDGALSMMALWDLDPLVAMLPEIQIPADLLIGQSDKTVPPNEGVDVARRIPGVTAHLIPDLGHLMHEEAPNLMAQRILELAAQPGADLANRRFDPEDRSGAT